MNLRFMEVDIMVVKIDFRLENYIFIVRSVRYDDQDNF